jgi:hypothetical protein
MQLTRRTDEEWPRPPPGPRAATTSAPAHALDVAPRWLITYKPAVRRRSATKVLRRMAPGPKVRLGWTYLWVPRGAYLELCVLVERRWRQRAKALDRVGIDRPSASRSRCSTQGAG